MNKIVSTVALLSIAGNVLMAGGDIVPVEPIVQTPIEETDNWEFSLAPFYLWAMDMDGDAVIGGNTASVDVSFDEITDNLEKAFIVHFEGMHQSDFGFLVDINYVSLHGSQTNLALKTIDVDMDMTIAEFSALYRMQMEEHAFDLIAGMRYVNLDMDLKISSVGTVPGFGPGIKVDWVDPLVGARWMYNINEEWSVLARGDIGGFGVSSDFTWQALGLFEWKPYEHVSFIAGYRILDIDYDQGFGPTYFRYNVQSAGPLVGVNFRW